MTVIITLIALGFLSLLERILLAATQLRRGPSSVAADGFALVILDGIKLYSKSAGGIFTPMLGSLICAISFALLAVVMAALLSCALWSWTPTDMLVLHILLMMELTSLTLMVPLLLSSTGYAALGSMRALKASLFASIVIDTGVVAMVLTLSMLQVPAHIGTHSPILVLLIYVPLACAIMLASGKAPFDLSEAESELVAGSLTELGGIAFSLILVSEYAEATSSWSLLSVLIWAGVLGVLFVVFLSNMSLGGRVLLSRFQVVDVPRFVFVTPLWPLGLFINY